MLLARASFSVLFLPSGKGNGIYLRNKEWEAPMLALAFDTALFRLRANAPSSEPLL